MLLPAHNNDLMLLTPLLLSPVDLSWLPLILTCSIFRLPMVIPLVGAQHVFHVCGIDIVGYFGKTNPQYTIGLVHVSKFMSSTPEIEVCR